MWESGLWALAGISFATLGSYIIECWKIRKERERFKTALKSELEVVKKYIEEDIEEPLGKVIAENKFIYFRRNDVYLNVYSQNTAKLGLLSSDIIEKIIPAYLKINDLFGHTENAAQQYNRSNTLEDRLIFKHSELADYSRARSGSSSFTFNPKNDLLAEINHLNTYYENARAEHSRMLKSIYEEDCPKVYNAIDDAITALK